MTDFERSGPPPQSGAVVFLQVGLGIVLVFLLHAIVGGSLWGAASAAAFFGGTVAEALNAVALMWAVGLGIVQALYVLPVAAALFFVRRPIALGMAIGAALTFVLQGACYGALALMVATA